MALKLETRPKMTASPDTSRRPSPAARQWAVSFQI